jgi:hypothetical protein
VQSTFGDDSAPTANDIKILDSYAEVRIQELNELLKTANDSMRGGFPFKGMFAATKDDIKKIQTELANLKSRSPHQKIKALVYRQRDEISNADYCFEYLSKQYPNENLWKKDVETEIALSDNLFANFMQEGERLGNFLKSTINDAELSMVAADARVHATTARELQKLLNRLSDPFRQVVLAQQTVGIQPKPPQADPTIEAGDWRKQALSMLTASISQSKDTERQVLAKLRRSKATSQEFAKAKQHFSSEREHYVEQQAELRKLEGEKLVLAYQKAQKAEAEAQRLAAKEREKVGERESARSAASDANRNRARQIFGNVELVQCPFCGPTSGICSNCSGTGFAPKR